MADRRAPVGRRRGERDRVGETDACSLRLLVPTPEQHVRLRGEALEVQWLVFGVAHGATVSRLPGDTGFVSDGRDRGLRRRCSIRKQRHRQPLATPEEHRAGDGRRPESIAHLVERGVDPAVSERANRAKLDRGIVVEVAEGQADQRDPLDLGSSASPRRAGPFRQRGSSGCPRWPPRGCATSSRARSRRTAAEGRPSGTRGGPLAACA